MDIQNYISSGILELYVYGALSEKESREVSLMLKKYPEIKEEVREIENALMKLSGAAAPSNPEALIASIKSKLSDKSTATAIPISKTRTNWMAYAGWAASILLLIGLFFVFENNSELQESLKLEQAKNAQLEQQIVEARKNSEKSNELLAVLRDREISRISLEGQNVAPDAFAMVYWNDSENTAFIDAQALPEPPRGKVYQVWSLKMDPLTPTSIGLLEEFKDDENKIFTLENTNDSEGFGITLEPDGGSETPTMEQLYVLGTVASL